jgi:deoxyribonuclease V
MKIIDRHPWNLSVREAINLQADLAAELRPGPRPQSLNLVAGVDAAYARNLKKIVAGAVVWDIKLKRVVERAVAVGNDQFPYVSGLLTFREGPAIIEAARMMEAEPQVILFDGQGRAHPRHLGIAAHLGLLLNRPTIGCAKSRLYGNVTEPGSERGSIASLIDPVSSEQIGSLVRTRTGVKPVYVSAGHLAELSWACRLILELAPRFRLPEPLRAAHHLATQECHKIRGTF